MTITNRLTVYFLSALALMLIAFSLALYFLASWHLNVQADRHLRASMDLLVAAVEVHPADVEWEPLERQVTLGDSNDPSAVRWTLHDEAGKLVDCSANVADQAWPDDEQDWRLLVFQLNAGQFEPIEVDKRSLIPTESLARLPKNRSAKGSKFLLTVGLSNAPIQAELFTLALALSAISVVACVIAGLWMRSLCRRALRPVQQMAQAARQLQATPECESLLSVPASNDELTELGRSFNGLLGTLRESIDRQARFAGDASHQLRTPLTATQAAVDVALRRERTVAEYQRVLTIVQRRNRELTKIVETLLALARQAVQDAGSQELIDLNRCCQERIDLLSDHERAADLRFRSESPSVPVKCDPFLAAQIIDNLIDNACKYSEPGTPITVQTITNAKEATVSVTDQGLGISKADLSQVFEPFFRTEQARWTGRPGVGLGLTIARRLAQIAGGHLEVSSVLGTGSVFRLVLPADAQTPFAIAAVEEVQA